VERNEEEAKRAGAARAEHVDDYPDGLPMPWEADPPGAPDEDPDAPRVRHDAFTPRRQNALLRAFARSGCLADACRETGVSPRTVYNLQARDPEFLRLCRLAASMCATPVELSAWERGVTGVEESFACGGKVYTRLRRSDHILRLLMQGSNPKKYGRNPGFTRKRVLKHERRQMEREIRAEVESGLKWSFKDSLEELEKRLKAHGVPIKWIEPAEMDEDERRAAGWTRTGDGHWIPPGYGPLAPPAPAAEPEGGAAGAAAGERSAERGEEPPRDSV
jgi:hypothetical protein